MKVIKVRNVNHALQAGLEYIYQEGLYEDSRAGPVWVSPCPVTTVYEKPQERVLFSAARDANPFFHIFESLFYLAGKQDARWLDQFVHDFSARFAEEDGTLHGSYGHRWRKHFDLEGCGATFLPDQLDTVVEILRNNPQSRQAVIQMWDPVADLGQSKKDLPCNLTICLRIKTGPIEHIKVPEPVLDITVFCRSNDICLGAYGANAVQFSVLLEYLAARIGVGIGTYYQVSHNYHAYKDMLDKLEEKAILEEGHAEEYPAEITPIVTVPEYFDSDLYRFFDSNQASGVSYVNPFFKNIAVPLYWAHHNWKLKNRQAAWGILSQMPQGSDWRLAAEQWFARRMPKSESMVK